MLRLETLSLEIVSSSPSPSYVLMDRRPASLPHTGIATFAKAPLVDDVSELEADVAVMGVPFDASVGMRPGCRQAPRAIRDASTRFGFLGRGEAGGYYDVNVDRTRLEGVEWADVGDADVLQFEREYNFKNVDCLVRGILDAGAMPVVLGGDHSISYPVIRAFEAFDPLTIVLLDAHLDYRTDWSGQRYTNISPFRRSHELPYVGQILTFGIRGIKSTGREVKEMGEHGHVTVPNYTFLDTGAETALSEVPEEIGNYYVSIDIDVLDPSIAPGTESPEAEGLTYTHAKRLLQRLAKRGTMVGLDVTEVNPQLDPTEKTQHIAAQLVIEALGTRFD